MKHKNIPLLFISSGTVVLIAFGIFLATATPASAQCGSQASSCKNCHEVQGQDPVNSDGTEWHQSHAFGDFCYICHGGNQQATTKDAAHQGMEDPLSDIKAACQECHATDLEARAQVYATILGVKINSGSASATSEPSAAASVSTTATSAAVSGQNCNEIVVDDPTMVNYAQTYDEIVLGKKPVNWGNTILMAMIGLVVVGGGGFVVTREKLVKVKFGNPRKVKEEYPADVVEMLPKLASLNSSARKALKHILDDPKEANKVLNPREDVVEKDEE